MKEENGNVLENHVGLETSVWSLLGGRAKAYANASISLSVSLYVEMIDDWKIDDR